VADSGIAPDAILARIATSRRYRTVSDEVILRLAGEEIPKSRNLADAEKRTKRRLHQIFGAYTGQPDYPSLLVRMTAAHERGDDEEVRALCRTAMEWHASTRERLPILDRFYAAIFAITGVPESIVDLACGLNPLAFPWMGLADGATYVACDIDSGLVGFVAGFLDLLGVEHRVRLCDVVASPPNACCDVALLLKSVPCLDQQDPTTAVRVLSAIDARHYVITFPTQSLGGRGKGMARNYRTRFEALRTELGWESRHVDEIELPGELIFIVKREG
jgi:16S rRNA (guanine(1405)-N(7))-methyltransferase